jgi:hypothetical protein
MDMGHYRIADLRSAAFDIVTLDEAASIAMLDPDVIEWAIEQHGVCETDCHRITAHDFLEDNGGIPQKALLALPSPEEFEAQLARR